MNAKTKLQSLVIIGLIISTFNCNKNEGYPIEDIKYNLEKYAYLQAAVYNEGGEILNIEIDSIYTFPKYLYLKDKIQSSENVITSLRNDPDIYNETVRRLAIEKATVKLDSIKLVFKKTERIENYYKCEASYDIKVYDTVRPSYLSVILDDKFEVIDTFIPHLFLEDE